MKKNVLIAFIIILSLGVATIAYSTTTPQLISLEQDDVTILEVTKDEANESRETDLNLSNGMMFTGEEISLSLLEMQELVLTNSSGIELAKINRAANRAKKESYYKMYSLTKDEQPDYVFGGVITSSKTERDMAKLAADFATTQSEANYNAEINQLNYDTIKKYFELKQAIDARKISENNKATQETILKNTNSKFKLGVASKQDVLKAEVSYNQAVVDLANAQSMESIARMSFNSYFGFDLMQKVVLTDELDVISASNIPLEEAITSALTNRNEIKGAEFSKNYSEMNLKNTGNNFSKASAHYLQAQADFMAAEKNYREIVPMIEMDVRSKYGDMMNAMENAELGRLNMEKSAETFRLAQLQYDMGMATLTDVQMAQSGAYGAELQYSQGLLKLRLSVISYENATKEGTYSVRL